MEPAWTKGALVALAITGALTPLVILGAIVAQGGMMVVNGRDVMLRQHRFWEALQVALKAVRAHWGIENCMHWVLDVAFREDDCRIRVGDAAQNFAILRRIALNLLKNEKSVKLGIANKRLKAGWNTDYLAKVLGLPV